MFVFVFASAWVLYRCGDWWAGRVKGTQLALIISQDCLLTDKDPRDSGPGRGAPLLADPRYSSGPTPYRTYQTYMYLFFFFSYSHFCCAVTRDPLQWCLMAHPLPSQGWRHSKGYGCQGFPLQRHHKSCRTHGFILLRLPPPPEMRGTTGSMLSDGVFGFVK